MSKKGVSKSLPWGGYQEWSGSSFKRCFESHPPLKIGEYVIYGGSCSSPVVKDADIYVGLDYSIAKSSKSYPWNDGESFLFHIQDMQAPSDPDQFKKLIEWLALQLIAGKKVHVGCIGGHGRTGTVLAALVQHMTGEVNAIEYVRENYCEKAVESQSQVSFLKTHFGIKEAKPHKHFGASSYYGGPTKEVGKNIPPSSTVSKQNVLPLDSRPSLPSQHFSAEPTKHPMAIWGPHVVFDKSGETGIM